MTSMQSAHGDQNTTRDGVLGADAPEVITTDQANGRELARYPVPSHITPGVGEWLV
jgi:hypothetical protein